jgi:hypothetical protein
VGAVILRGKSFLHVDTYMHPNDVEKLLDRLRTSGLPGRPKHLPENVWREIGRRKDGPFSVRIHAREFLDWFRGGLIGPALAMALVLGVGQTLLSDAGNSSARAQQALGLQVFSRDSSPLTRLAQNP